MPRVPELRQERTQERQLSTGGGFQSASFGGAQPIAAIGKVASQVANTGMKILEVEKKKADKVRIMGMEQELQKYQDDLLWNPSTGYYRKSGQDAMPASSEVMENYNKKTEELESGLENESQRTAFREVSQRWAQSLNRGVQRHGFREAQKAQQALTESTIANERNNAVQNYGDVTSVGQSLAAIEGKIKDIATDRGMPQEWVQARVASEKSQVHTRIMQQMINDGNYLGAKQYHGNVKDLLVGTDATTASRLVKNGTVRGESQRIADQILFDNKFMSQDESLKKARQVKDPEVRDAVVARVKNRFAEQKALIKQEEEALYLEAENYVKEKKPIPPDVWVGLSLKNQNALAKYGNNVKNDDEKWLDFLDLNERQLGTLTRSEFQSKYWVNFNQSKRTKAENMWNQAKNADPDFTRTMNFNQRAMNSYVSAGLASPKKNTWSKTDRNEYMQLQGKAEEDLFELETKLGRKATGPEQQEIFDNLVLQKVFIKRNFRRDPEVPFFLIPEEDKGEVYVPMDEIPEADKAKLENLLRSKQKYVTDEKIEHLYGAWVTGNREKANRILGR